MSSIFSDGALHPGRDANDAWWIVVRRAEDWGNAFDGTSFDPSRGVELAPAPMAPDDGAAAVAIAPDGTIYRADPFADQVTRQRPCDAAPAPVACGVRDPRGLAVDDHGLLFVADHGNHRVQVIDADEGRLVIALAVFDPIAVAVGRSRIFVAEGAARPGRIDVYDRAYRFDRSFVATGAGGAPADIGAIVADGDAVVVLDLATSRLVRYRCTGERAGEVAWADAPAALAPFAARARYALEGTVVVGPIDGGADRLAWHQVAADVELPPGTTVEVQTFAMDPPSSVPPAPPPGPPLLPTTAAWAPARPVAMPAAGLEPSRGELARPILSDTAAWDRWRAAPYRRGAAVYTFGGDGPNAVASLAVPATSARVLRAGDGVELVRAAVVEPATVLAIADRSITIAAGGDRVAYGAATTVTLVERDGRALDAATIYVLSGAETFDLSGFTADGDVGDVVVPHALAAILHPGDVVELGSGAVRARAWIDAIDPAPAAIALTAPLAGNFTIGDLRVVTPAGRFVVDHADGWGDGFPPGDALAVDWDNGGQIAQQILTVAWSDPATATVWTTTAAPATWLAFSPALAPSPTDRGRYLWIKLRLIGAHARRTDAVATASPVVRALRLVAPRLSYLRYLPAVFARRDDDDPTGALFLERYLALFEHRLTSIEARYESVARLLDPLAADDEWIEFVGSWFALVFDPSWPRARRARLLTEIFELYRRRGTVEGLRRFVEIYTGHRPEILEGFQIRPRAGLVLGCEGTLGCAPLGGLDTGAAASADLLGQYAHRFTMIAYVDAACDLAVTTTALRALVDTIKPLHTDVDLQVVVPGSRIGLATTVGFDFILGDGAARAPSSPLGAAPVLGVDATLGGRGLRAGPRLDDGVGATVGNLELG